MQKYIDNDMVKSFFPKLNVDANKGTQGHLLCLCGSYTMPGAAVICAKSALHSGVGLVKITTPVSAYPLIASHLVEPIYNPVEEYDGRYSEEAIKPIIDDLEWANSVVLGCGMGVSTSTKYIAKKVLLNSKVPIILDADGINSITSCIDILKDVKVPVVLTPHPGEMARLTSKTVSEVQSNRISIAKDFAKEYGVIVVLKGANTVVTNGEEALVNLTGNPGMATGGTGDMLSGLIGSFSAQGIDLYKSAIAGVYIHSLCGDVTSKELSMRGLTVSDMIDRLGALMSQYE